MAEYIEREALLKRFCERCNEDYESEPCEPSECFAIQVMREIPAADVAPVVHGKWEFPTMFGYQAFHIPHCSACGGVPCGVDENTKFCPNCGAHMKDGDGNG